MIKKKILYLGAAASIVAPVAVVLSCGTSASDPNQLELAMRAEDVNAWQKIFDDFKVKTGVNVKIRLAADQKADYATWAGTDSMPTLALADQNTAKDAIKEDKWFQNINLTDIKQAKYDVANQVPKEFDFEDNNQYLKDKVFAAFYDKAAGQHQVVGIPYGYGSQGVYLNKNKLTMSNALYAYVPKKDGTFAKVEVVPAGSVTMPVIAEFLKNSGLTTTADTKATALTKIDTEIQNDFVKKQSSDDKLVWYDNGPLAMYQRLGSISKSLGPVDGIGWMKDISLPFELVASLGGDIFNGTLLNDAKLRKILPLKGSSLNSSNADFLKLYQSYYGYFNKSSTTATAANPKAVNEPGEADAIWSGKGNTLLGYKWQMGMIKDNWYKKDSTNAAEQYDAAVSILPAPYGSIGVDALAIAKNVSGEQLVNAKKFIRFALEQGKTDNAYNVTLQKTISPIVAAETKQKTDVANNSKLTTNDKARIEAFFNSSTGTKYENVTGGIMAASTDGIYDIYNGQYGSDTGLKSALVQNRPNNYVTWKRLFDSILPKVAGEVAIKEA